MCQANTSGFRGLSIGCQAMRLVRWWTTVCLLMLVPGLGCASAPKAALEAAGAPAPALNTGPSTIVVGQQKCCPKQTLPQFLGLTGLAAAGCDLLTQIRSRLGMLWPGLEPGAPLLPINDPANMDSSNPAVAAAADAKAQEDGAQQKIKAFRYLATLGCGGCYPDIESALLAGLDDCTEEVRYEAALAIRKTGGTPCQFCRDQACCSPKVREKLKDIGFGVDETTQCFKEPSARVRRIARLGLDRCGGPSSQPTATMPEEGPEGPAAPAPLPAPEATLAPAMNRPEPHGEVASPSRLAPCPTCTPTGYFPTHLPPTGSTAPTLPNR